MLMATVSYLLIDVHYLIWLNSLESRVPTFISASFSQASLGTMDTFYKRIGEFIHVQQIRKQRQYDQSRRDLQCLDA
jgi:hypothetical protein